MNQEHTGNGFRVGVDIGGTFTDIVFISKQGKIFTKKVSSTTGDFTKAIITGLQEVISEHGLRVDDIIHFVHGCTVATNAILEHTGARGGLITTKGFRDILEIRRFRMPELYNYHWEKPVPLVPRELRLEVDESIDFKGEILRPLDIEGAKTVIDRLVSKGVESMAVCLLNSYVNPVHEQKIKGLIKEKYPDMHVTLSSELIPMIKEYERTSEVVVNAYVRPIVAKYLVSLTNSLREIGVNAPLLLMQSSGGMMSFETGIEKPINIIECGPAAGVVGCSYLAHKLGISNVLTLDMGGTTTKASIIENNEVSRAAEYEVGAGISISSRLCTGGGYVIRVPSIDIAEIGAGGGSKLWLDAGGALHVGPRSAGAVPGPVCYDIGGDKPTLSDANLVLGYLNPEYLAGGSVRLNAAKAHKVIEEKVAKPLDMEPTAAAYGAHLIANSNMMRAIRAVSTERGRDPRDFILFAYGGAGPMHAAALARELGIKRVVVPLIPGLFSAFGLLFAEIEHHFSETFLHRLDETVVDTANKIWEAMKKKALAEVEAANYGDVEVVVEKSADLRYIGQSSELTIPVPWELLQEKHVTLLAEQFNEEHLRTYAHKRIDEPIDIVTLRLVAKIPSATELLLKEIESTEARIAAFSDSTSRKAYFGKDYGWLNTPILKRQDIFDKPVRGPAIVEFYDSTCVIPPYCLASAGAWGTIMLDIES